MDHPSVPAAVGTDWFQSGNNYLQANLIGTSLNASGKISIRKDQFSPTAVREMALIITGIKNNTYSISTARNPVEGGTITGGGTCSLNDNAMVTATPNQGYNFLNWTENGNVISSEAAYSFTVTANRSLVANFDVVTSIDPPLPFTMYPNPTATLLHIQADSVLIEKIRIFDTSGRILFEKDYKAVSLSIDVSSLLTGTYFIEVSSGKRSLIRRFIKK